ncbi:S6 family peptidase [Gallibacterium anatis]|uniref:S6 family peptidase n=1 Tax=Gallibacterium anatis TaxID=750 RepID=UPI002549F01D|nr:S6 family peptidase [Gallibacterium anatis]WIM85266.1 S6 family peptidase [Gallibacterium anatis]
MLLHSILRFKYTKVAFFVSSILASAVANASRVRADIDYQYFRDFAENKGQFTVGASNIPIFNKNNEKIGVMMQGIPMPDLNIANKNGGFASLIDNAFVSSVQHNRGYGSVQFGDQDNKPDSHTFDYLLTSRNEMTSGENGYLKKPRAYETDYHVPRLHKLVTEVAPISVTDAFIENNDKENYNTYGINGSGRFLSYVRVGSGDQSVYDLVENKITNITDAYNFLTGGGILGVHSVQGHTLWSKGNKLPDNTWVQDSRSLFGTDYGVMPTWGDAGDSGSPLLGYDSKLKKWVAVGVLIGGTQPPNAPYITVFNIHYPGYIKLVKDKFTAGIVQNNTNTEWEWAVDDNDKSTSHIHSEQASLKVNLYNESLSANDSHQSRPSIDYGQDVIFNGDTDGKLILNQDINQGAGALYFNTNFTVAPKEDQTWLGGGISIAEGKYVVWKVKNPENDRLSKIGAGMLYVNGKGKNLGDISIGDGTVIFNQREDENGLKQAFNKVGITSGRPILTLNSEDQINPDNLYFGFRGGRLDLNGNSLTMQYIRHSDSGAQIVNHNTNIGATLTLTGTEPFTADQIQWGQHGEKGKDLYEYKNQWAAGRTDYFVLVGDEPWRYYPTNQDSSKNWKFISSDKATAMQFIVDSKNTSTEFRYKTFEGTLGETDFNKGSNGALDVIYRPKIANSTLLLNGTINLNGNLEVEEGNVIISGRPVPHARDINNKEVILDNEWINTSHTASAMIVKNSATLTIGRNVSEVNTIFSVTDKAVLNLGYRTGQDVCYRSNYSGNTQCDKPNYSQEVLNTIPQTLVKGHIILDNESTANLSNVIFQGRAIAKAGTHINLFSNSLWELTQNSQVGYLTLEDNAHIVLKSRRNGYTNLIVQNDLNGQGVLDFNTNIGSSLGNKLIVNGALRGSLTLLVKDQAKTLSTTDSLTLIQFNPNEENNFTFILQNSENGEPYVDAGAWRYKAKKNLDAIVLTNPYVNPDAPENIKERIKEKAAELQAKQAEQERLAKEQAEQERLAKEQAEQERLAKERAEQERLAKERAEQERLAKERAEQERLAKEQAEQERLAKERAEQERLAQERAEQERLAKERAEQERLAQERAEQERLAKERAEQERLAQERAEQERLAKEQAEQERLAKERAEQERLAKERAEQERLAKEQAEQERLAKERAEQERLAKERAEQERLAKERAEQERLAKEQAEQERLAKERAEQERLAKEQAKQERLAKEQAEQERLAKEQAEQERLAQERAEQERLAQERAEQERLAKEQAEQERLAKKQAANISSTANMMLSEFAAQVNINLQFARLLNQQLATKNNKTTIWTNFAQQKTRHFSDNYRAYQQNLNINEIGIQSLINDKGQSVGAIFSNAYATNYLSDNATSTTKVNQVTLYLKQQLTPKSFVTMDISYGRSHNELKLKKQNEHFHRQMYSIGLGFGQSFSLFGIELQTLLGMRNYHYNNVSYQFNGININTKDLNLLNYYSELTIAKMWRTEDIEFKPLISLHYDNFAQRELNDKMNIDNISLKQDFGESVYYETGIDINFYQKWQISSRLGVGKGNNSRKAKNAEIKLSYLF